MLHLLVVSIIWAFSFGLIKGKLAGLDPHFVAFARLLISFVFFLPFLSVALVKRKSSFRLFLLGVLQFGLMYILYINAYPFLQAWQVALFTIFTPLYVALISDLLEKRWRPLYSLAALVAVAGAAVLVFQPGQSGDMFYGFVLIQLSNICFAAGQIFYKRLRPDFEKYKDRELFVVLYAGAFAASGINSAFMTPWASLELNAQHVWVLLYLGIIASGICFFLWNYGATKTNAAVLAVMNNLKIPFGIIVAFLVFGESADMERLLWGALLIAGALLLAYYAPQYKPDRLQQKSNQA